MTLDLAKLRAETLALIEGIAPGWKKASNGSQVFLGERGGVASLHGSGGCIKRNSRLIAAAPTLAADALRLLDEIERLRAENERMRAVLARIASGKYSGFAIATNPPKDPAVEIARAALAEGGPDDR